MALAGELEHRAMMNKAIDHRGGRHLVRENLEPFLKWQISRERDTATLISCRDHVEQ